MSTVLEERKTETLADLVAGLGDVPLNRIRIRPALGTAVEQDVLDIHDHEDRLFELVDGVLVEKAMGYSESLIAALLIQLLRNHVERDNLGLVAAPDGMMRLRKGLVRMPDVSVVLWERLPERKAPREPIPSLVPDLAVEVLSKSNTAAEIDRKLREYFAGGCQCAWVIDPDTRSARVYDSPEVSVLLTGEQIVTAEAVLPGFQITVSEIFIRSGIA